MSRTSRANDAELAALCGDETDMADDTRQEVTCP